MSAFDDLARRTLHLFPPETAHNLAIGALRAGLVPARETLSSPLLAQQVAGLSFPNPVGLAAGFDKNAEAADALFRQGFGFVETGTVTPRPQPGNPHPRLFRLTAQEAIINRMGFNNHGLEAFTTNLRCVRRPSAGGILGANIGANKDSEDVIADYVTGLRGVYGLCDYVTVNISSPNTPGLRDWQAADSLRRLLDALLNARAELAQEQGATQPLFVKLAPDLAEEELDGLAALALDYALDGLILTNTTLDRPALADEPPHYHETGGLSGRPLMPRSTALLRGMYQRLQGRIPLIGVGGIASAEDAWGKITAGAALIQLYSALIYQGFGLVEAIAKGLEEKMKAQGFSSLAAAVGSDCS